MENLALENDNLRNDSRLPPYEARLNQAISDYALESATGVPPETEDFLGRQAALADDLAPLIQNQRRVDERTTAAVEGSNEQGGPSSLNLRKSDGRCQLKRVHAVGGLGRVWEAWDSELGRNVAIKERRRDRPVDPGMTARFLQEAAVAGRLEHPGNLMEPSARVWSVQMLPRRLASILAFSTAYT